MELLQLIDELLMDAVVNAEIRGGPPTLGAAMRHAVFPGGARIRPRLCLAVAMACGETARNATAEAAATAIELLHCASLVHDDLPCFDNAPLRRGLPSVHAQFGERIAILAGDALIVLAFQTLGRGLVAVPERLPALLGIVARSVGMPGGICAGQAWESEATVRLAEYQCAKTGALFAAATAAGALAAGADYERWRLLGERLGEAYQVADDVQDAAGDAALLGKPTGIDQSLGRPSSARELGLRGALERFGHLVEAAVAAIPECPGRVQLTEMIRAESHRLIPEHVHARAA